MPPSPLPPEALLEHAAWLRRLAGSLVHGDADDLVQETWLAALRSPPADDRPARGWLAEVVKNAARMRARAAGRRTRRETESASLAEDAAPSPEVLLDRLEAQRRLAELVADLAEPFRSTLLLRYFEGLSAAEIARRQGVPAGTVRWRLKEGLDRLRVALDRESGGDRKRWCLLLAPLAGPRDTWWTTLLKGIRIMSRATKLTTVMATLLLLLGAGGLWWRARPAPQAARVQPSASASLAAPPAPQVARPPSEPARGALLTLSAATAVPDEAAENGVFEGRIIDWSSGKGVTHAEVTFSLDGATALASTDDEGRFRFAPARPGRCALALVTAADYLPFAPEWGHSPIQLFARPKMRVRDITVYLVPALDYLATVVDPDGKPVAGATVTLLGAAQGEQALAPIQDRFTSNDCGEVHFHAPDDALLEARHPAFAPGRARFDGAAATSHRLQIRLRAKATAEVLGAERIAGRVVDAGGAPVAGALVRAEPEDRGREALHPSAQALSDPAGRFTLEGLDAGSYAVTAAHAGFAPARDRVSAGAADVVLGLRRGGVLAGRVIDAEGGAPLPAFTVIVARREGPVKEITVAVRSVIDPDGRFTIPDLDPGEYRLRANAHAHAPTRPVDVIVPEPPAEGRPVELALGRGARLTGKVIDAGGAPIELARISIENAFGDASVATPIVSSALTNDRGEFDLAGIPPGARSIMVAAYAHHIRILSGMSFVDGATVGPITVDLTPTKDGEEPRIELAGIGAQLTVDGDGLRVDKLIPGGGGEAAGLVPGDILLAVDGSSVATLGFDGAIQLIRGPVGSTVRLTIRKAGGAVVDVVAERRRIRA
ncbi:MAG: sigma-70 family RNA polymerase sigma factor [Minicystis sp.]